MAPDVIYLGKIGLLTSSSGLKLAYASPNIDFEAVKNLEVRTSSFSDDFQGLFTILILTQFNLVNFPTDDCLTNSSLVIFSGVDILMTSDWPKGLGSGEDSRVQKTDGNPLISRLAVKLKPRYHFSGTKGVFYERTPYRNHKVMSSKTTHCTRFITLAKVANAEKEKWIYAFNLVPMKHMERSELIAQPPSVTDIPYTQGDLEIKETSTQFFYDMNAPMEDKNRKRKGDKQDFKAKRQPREPQGPCWFCLSSAEVEKHLVVSIGDHAYLALPKGPLNENHVMILPIGCHRCALELPDEVSNEIEKFKSALKKLFKKEGLTCVFFERNYKSKHMQLQVIGLPLNYEKSLKDTFMDIGSSMQITFDDVPDHAELPQLAETGTPYFFVELPTDRLFHRVRSGFPIQFGREVLCSPDLLDCESKIDWRSCASSKDEEAASTQKFRQRFAEFDFTLEDDD